MIDHEETWNSETETPAGELVILNGKRRGLRIPLRLPLTLIGRAELCDVRIESTDVADIHCAVSITPLGPTLRSWQPDSTFVNGNETAARVLKTNDELRVGPCVARVVWHAEEFVSLVAAPVEEAIVNLAPAFPTGDVATEFGVSEPVRTPGEQEADLAAKFEEQRRKVAEWMRELADHREAYRQQRIDEKPERERLRRMRVETERLHDEAKTEREKARTLFTRLRRRFHTKWKAERDAVLACRDEMTMLRGQLDQDIRRFHQEKAEHTAESLSRRHRLQAAWDALTEGQRRLLEDRRETESMIANREKLLAKRTSAVNEQEKSLTSQREETTKRVQALRDEIARLELRANHARASLQQTETQRHLTIGDLPTDAVAIDGTPTRDGQTWMAELQIRDHELNRERTSLAAAQSEIDRRAAVLMDERRVIAEQATTLLVAQQSWQDVILAALGELETMVRHLAERELELQSRENEIEFAEQRVAEQRDTLATVRVTLDARQTAIATREFEIEQTRLRHEAEATAKFEHLHRWESALSTLCHKWALARKRDRHHLKRQVALWVESRQKHRLAAATCDELHRTLLSEAAKLAEQSLALEQLETQRTGTSRSAARRLRVLRKTWESHFTRLLKGIDTRRFALSIETSDCDDRFNRLTKALDEVTEQRNETAERQQRFEAERLAWSNDADQTSTQIAIHTERAEQAEAALAALRDELERRAHATMQPDVLPHPALTAARDAILLSLVDDAA